MYDTALQAPADYADDKREGDFSSMKKIQDPRRIDAPIARLPIQVRCFKSSPAFRVWYQVYYKKFRDFFNGKACLVFYPGRNSFRPGREIRA
jgi:hypothetical protein